ncbi:hypothetical protein G7046_g968 [Stylonectria norvegica]|nr:hypothetical protein G7046_g968 [Stylonectria norvegica]
MMKSKVYKLTPLENMVLAFGAAVTAATLWTVWGSDLLPAEGDPKGDPNTWTREEMRRWLAARSLFPNSKDTREELLARVLANMRIPQK